MHFKKTNLFGKFVKKGWCTIDETHRSGYNFCDFFKAVAWGLLWSTIFFYLVGWFLVFGIPPWLLYFFSDFPLPWATDLTYGFNIHASSTVFGGIVVLVAAFGIMAYCDAKIKEWYWDRQRRLHNLPPKPPKVTWFSELHQAFKDKYCPLVTFEE